MFESICFSVQFKNMTSLQSNVDILFLTGTPLHVAVKKHSKKVNCSQTVAFLLKQGADVLAQVCTILLFFHYFCG
jgi:hypothetical protein